MKNKFTILFVTLCLFGFSQNVAINATGAAPNVSAMLDIASTTSGLLVPRMTTAQRTAIAAPATGLIVYDTTTGGFWYFDGVIWVQLLNTNTGWALVGNALVGTEFMGSTNAQPVRFFSNNTERMRIFSVGRVGINNTAAASGQLDVRGAFATAFADLATIFGKNTNGTGTGGVFVGQNAADNALVAGSGGVTIGTTTGLYAQYTTGAAGQGVLIQDAFGAQWNVGHWTGAAYRKIIGNGTVSTLAKGLNNEDLIMNCPETPENLFMDYGKGVLKNGYAKIYIDPILSKNIKVDESHPLKIFIQLEGDCNGVYVTNKTKESFEVKELKNGQSNVEFSYSIVATHGDEFYKSSNGEERKAVYDKRWEQAGGKANTIIPIITSEERK